MTARTLITRDVIAGFGDEDVRLGSGGDVVEMCVCRSYHGETGEWQRGRLASDQDVLPCVDRVGSEGNMRRRRRRRIRQVLGCMHGPKEIIRRLALMPKSDGTDLRTVLS